MCLSWGWLLLFLVPLGCRLPWSRDPEIEPPAILAAVYFYQSYSVGRGSPDTGLQLSRDGGASWETGAWPHLITSGIAVGDAGRWIYLAAGNGVLYSRDAGASWVLTGGTRLTEVQRVAFDLRDPKRVWAATAYGVYRADDITAPDPWQRLGEPDGVRFTNDVLQDRAQPVRWWLATESGLYLTDDDGGHFRRVGPTVRTRRLARDHSAPDRLWASSDGQGVLISEDSGETWSTLSGTGKVVFCVEQHPMLPQVLACGARGVVSVSHDGGRHWSHLQAGLPERFFVYDILFETSRDRIIVSGNDGLFEIQGSGSDPDRLTWSRLGFEKAVIPDLATARLAFGGAEPPSAAPGSLVWEDPKATFAEHREDDPEFEERRERLRRYFVERRVERTASDVDLVTAMVEIEAGRAGEGLWPRLETLLGTPRHSMFYSLPLTALFLHYRDRLPDDLRARMREVLTGSPVYRGDTENHWVMHYTALLLATQALPETRARDWYMGRPTQELYDEARDWLLEWGQLTAARGQGEFDSPQYIFMFVTPLLLLYDFAAEPRVRQLAGMMLDLLLADYLSESLEGAYCGGHSRDPKVLDGPDAVAIYHYLYAGGIPRPDRVHGWSFLAAKSSYRPPRLFVDLANRRSPPFVSTEVKRVRNVIRFGDVLNPPVHEYGYLTTRYGLGSLTGGILQPIQQHTWDVTWKGSAPSSLLFTVHPYVSGRELGMFFPEEVQYLVETVTAQKGTYASPDKWISSSPFEKIFQRENVLLALYQVPPGESFPHVNLHAPRHLIREERDGWIFGRDGDFFVAWYATRDGTWTPHGQYDRFRCSGDHSGFVVVVRPPTDITYPAFREGILERERPLLTGNGDDLKLTFRAPGGERLARRWGDDDGTVDGQPLVFPRDRLFDGPFLKSALGSRVIQLIDGRRRRVLDFRTLEIRVEE